MADETDVVLDNHRRQRRLAFAGSALLIALSIAPHNERGLFLAPQADAAVLAAIVPPTGYETVPIFLPPEDDGTAFFARVPGAPVGARPTGIGGPELPVAEPVGPPGVAAAPSSAPDSAGGAPVQVASLLPETGGSGFPFGPPGLNPAGSSPAAGTDTSTGGATTSTGGDTSTGGTTTSTGGDTSTGGTTTSTSTGGPTTSTGGVDTSTGGKDTSTGGMTTSSGGPVIPAVPEPATWLMLIAGFGFVGAVLRRRRINSGAASALSS